MVRSLGEGDRCFVADKRTARAPVVRMRREFPRRCVSGRPAGITFALAACETLLTFFSPFSAGTCWHPNLKYSRKRRLRRARSRAQLRLCTSPPHVFSRSGVRGSRVRVDQESLGVLALFDIRRTKYEIEGQSRAIARWDLGWGGGRRWTGSRRSECAWQEPEGLAGQGSESAVVLPEEVLRVRACWWLRADSGI